jgi:nucleoid-associated protein EbfC
MAQQRRPNVQQMMQQVQKMQRDMEAAQEALKDEIVQGSAGGGAVTVTVSGDLEVKTVRIAPEAVDPDDAELLGEMVLAAVNEALRAAQELAAQRLGGATGGLDLGALGGLGLPGL